MLEKLEAVYDSIEENDWPQAAIYPMNLEGATMHDYEVMAETIGKEFGQLHGLLRWRILTRHKPPSWRDLCGSRWKR
jgi:hypothetical protein